MTFVLIIVMMKPHLRGNFLSFVGDGGGGQRLSSSSCFVVIFQHPSCFLQKKLWLLAILNLHLLICQRFVVVGGGKLQKLSAYLQVGADGCKQQYRQVRKYKNKTSSVGLVRRTRTYLCTFD